MNSRYSIYEALRLFFKINFAILVLILFVIFCFVPITAIVASIVCTKVAWYVRVPVFWGGVLFSVGGKPLSRLFNVDLKVL